MSSFNVDLADFSAAVRKELADLPWYLLIWRVIMMAVLLVASPIEMLGSIFGMTYLGYTAKSVRQAPVLEVMQRIAEVTLRWLLGTIADYDLVYVSLVALAIAYRSSP